ncbi:isochorismatase family protein [Suttonella sp. R2A3]|uniref:isochorismatase family protein n=1 Tax=Suttonella sp. R2A3 TaxID=2908648 RepID=UPI001F20D7AD|nr:isochorismatase family protein [Suttonella sp. R2A3]UJF24037.1 isochorismatase family protein [Suttonella sp. R2A3]
MQRIERTQTLALLIDVQERLTPHIHEHERVLARTKILLEGLNALDVPVMHNQQYKKGLGETVQALLPLLKDAPTFEKRSFSVCDNEPSMAFIDEQQRPICLLFGVETHVCVLQTALDLIDHGYQPVLITDACSSRNPSDHETALARMISAGVRLASVESILFELTRTSTDPVFKTISALVK